MQVTTKGKLYLILGLLTTGYGLWIDNALAGFVGGLLIAWSYWYWWRYIIFKNKLKELDQ